MFFEFIESMLSNRGHYIVGLRCFVHFLHDVVSASVVLFAMIVVVPPLEQGFYCQDPNIHKPRREDTVPASYLFGAGTLLPIATVRECGLNDVIFRCWLDDSLKWCVL